MPMKHDFNTPQRQSLIGIVVLAADSLQSNVRALFPLFIVAVFNGEKKGFLLVLAGLLLVAGIIIGYLQYLNFTFILMRPQASLWLKKVF
jgi:putative membrane protein